MTTSAQEPHVGLVVEGRGDLISIPILVRKHLHSKGDYRDLLHKPVPLHGRDKAIVPGGIEGYVATTASRPGCMGVIVILDSEGDDPVALATELNSRVAAAEVTKHPVFVLIIDQSFEDWIFASAETLDLNLTWDASRRGQAAIKEALRPKSYTEPVWQPRLTNRVDINLIAQRCPSFVDFTRYIDTIADCIK